MNWIIYSELSNPGIFHLFHHYFNNSICEVRVFSAVALSRGQCIHACVFDVSPTSTNFSGVSPKWIILLRSSWKVTMAVCPIVSLLVLLVNETRQSSQRRHLQEINLELFLEEFTPRKQFASLIGAEYIYLQSAHDESSLLSSSRVDDFLTSLHGKLMDASNEDYETLLELKMCGVWWFSRCLEYLEYLPRVALRVDIRKTWQRNLLLVPFYMDLDSRTGALFRTNMFMLSNIMYVYLFFVDSISKGQNQKEENLWKFNHMANSVLVYTHFSCWHFCQ